MTGAISARVDVGTVVADFLIRRCGFNVFVNLAYRVAEAIADDVWPWTSREEIEELCSGALDLLITDTTVRQYAREVD